MSEITPPVPSPQPSALSPAQITSAREHWASLGLDPARFDAALNAPSEPPASPPPPERPEVLPDLKQAPLTDAQAREMADALVAACVPEETVMAAMKADGVDPTPKVKTPEEAEHDRDFGFERDFTPSEYKIDYLSHGARGVDTAQLVALNEEATRWLADLRLDPALGAALVERAMQVGQRLAKMSEAGRELHRRSEYIAAERKLGGPEQVAAARARVAAVAQRGGSTFTEILHRAGAFHDAWIFLTLANHGDRLEQWAASAPKVKP